MRGDRLLVRLDVETRQLLQQLADRQGTSLSDAARLAIREAGCRRGLSTAGDLFTDRARRVLQLASDEAASRRADEIRPVHLLLGILLVAEGRAALMLRSLGVDCDRAYELADGAARIEAQPVRGTRGLSEAGKRVVEAAGAEANRLDHHYVGTEHLLVGVLRGGDASLAGIFERIGVSADAICATVELQKERLARVVL